MGIVINFTLFKESQKNTDGTHEYDLVLQLHNQTTSGTVLVNDDTSLCTTILVPYNKVSSPAILTNDIHISNTALNGLLLI